MLETELASVEVEPFVGLLNVTLGMSKEQVLSVLGEPNSRLVDDHGDDHWDYVEPDFECVFSSDDGGVLGSITCDSPVFTIKGIRMVGLSTEQLCRLVTTGVLPGLLLEDELPWLEETQNYECDSLGLAFWVSRGTVQRMTLFPRYDASGNRPIWLVDGRAD